HRQRPQLSGPDVFNGCGHDSEGHVDLATEQVGDCGATAAIRHVRHVDASHCLEQLAGQMIGCADAGGRYVDPAGISLGITYELRNGVGRERWIYDHDVGDAHDAGYGGDVANEIEIKFVEESGVDRRRHIPHEQRIAIGSCA